MSYLSFDKTLMSNLDRSLSKEMVRTNRAGSYSSTTIIDCNTRKYHGLLVVPLPHLDDANHVIISSMDETVIQHGAEFNLGVHEYQNGSFSPNGHKYIRQFDNEAVAGTIYRVGGVVLLKERLLVSFEPRILVKYTLLEAHSPTLLRFKPFLAFRRTDRLTHINNDVNISYELVEDGMATSMYEEYPQLYMQFTKKNEYVHQPDWYKNIAYFKEKDRGYEYLEDLYVPGYFEMPIKKGETIVFSAGFSEVPIRKLKALWDYEYSKRGLRTDMFSCLKISAEQFYKREGNKTYLLAGYPWFKCRARDQFMALPDCTLTIGLTDYFDDIMKTSIDEIRRFLDGEKTGFALEEIDNPDVLFWFIWAVQQYGIKTSAENAANRYGLLLLEIISFIRKQKHPRLFLHSKGLVYVDGREQPATWMNAVENGKPITPRTGYVVEINALWYNSLRYVAEIARLLDDSQTANLLDYQAEITRESFVSTFWNGTYLYDYVDGNYSDWEVRPNMVYAAGLPYSPLDRQQQKSILDIITRELLTAKGLRTLSPKSGFYRPSYVGGQLERDRNYHNGPVWPCTFGVFIEAYLRIYKESGCSFVRRMLLGFEAEMRELCIGTLNELYDGNPPFKGHGGMSFATSVSAILRVLNLIKKYDNE